MFPSSNKKSWIVLTMEWTSLHVKLAAFCSSLQATISNNPLHFWYTNWFNHSDMLYVWGRGQEKTKWIVLELHFSNKNCNSSYTGAIFYAVQTDCSSTRSWRTTDASAGITKAGGLEVAHRILQYAEAQRRIPKRHACQSEIWQFSWQVFLAKGTN